MAALASVTPDPKPQAILLFPNRELANFSYSELHRLGCHQLSARGISVRSEFPPLMPGGSDTSQFSEQIIVTTPSRLLALVRANLKMTESGHRRPAGFDGVRMLLINAIDEMVMAGVDGTLKKLICLLGRECQVVLSADCNGRALREHRELWKWVKYLAAIKSGHGGVELLSVLQPMCSPTPTVQHLFYRCDEAKTTKAKWLVDNLARLLGADRQCVVFVNAASVVDMLAACLMESGLGVSSAHGRMTEAARDQVLVDFQEAISRVLVTTDVLPRGVSLPAAMTLIVQYQLSVRNGGECDPERYIMRAGRAGVAGRRGVAITLISDEAEMTLLKQICVYFGRCRDLIQHVPQAASPAAEVERLVFSAADRAERVARFLLDSPTPLSAVSSTYLQTDS